MDLIKEITQTKLVHIENSPQFEEDLNEDLGIDKDEVNEFFDALAPSANDCTYDEYGLTEEDLQRMKSTQEDDMVSEFGAQSEVEYKNNQMLNMILNKFETVTEAQQVPEERKSEKKKLRSRIGIGGGLFSSQMMTSLHSTKQGLFYAPENIS